MRKNWLRYHTMKLKIKKETCSWKGVKEAPRKLRVEVYFSGILTIHRVFPDPGLWSRSPGPPFGPGGERPEPLPLPGGRWTFLGLGGRAAAPCLPAPPSDQGQVGAESGSRGPAESASKG